MATLLEKYTDLRTGLVEKVMNGVLPLDKVLVYQEILYRIDVLESCQLFVKKAPVTTDTKVLAYHYQMWDVYIYHMLTDHKFGQPADEKQKQVRETAANSLLQVVNNCRKQFSSFKPTTAELYKQSINTLITTVLPAWVQYRETYISLKEEQK